MATEKCKPASSRVSIFLTRFQPDSLLASGADMVYAQAVFAIVGALALEQGGAVANRVAKERILLPLRKTGRMRSDAGPARLETEPSARA